MKILNLQPQSQKQRIKYNNSSVNNDFSGTNRSNVSFGSSPVNPKSKFFVPLDKVLAPFKKVYDNAVDCMAMGIAKSLHVKPVQSIIEKAADNKHCNDYLYAHLTTLTSVVLSGFYIKKTLENDRLDEKKKKTLAINQGVVAVVSTIVAYAANNFIDKKFDKFMKNYCNIAKNDNYKKGLKIVKATVIFGTIYRFIAPVLATPIANAIGNRVHERKEAKSQKVNQK